MYTTNYTQSSSLFTILTSVINKIFPSTLQIHALYYDIVSINKHSKAYNNYKHGHSIVQLNSYAFSLYRKQCSFTWAPLKNR
jgi:hypothetical protein